MAITIDLTPAVEARLRKEAEFHGIPTDRYVASLLEKTLLPPTGTPADLTTEEWRARLKQFIGSIKGRPLLHPEVLRREHLYNTDKDGNYID
ncbi:MAG: hypothetical protein ABI823_15440 [Bryobacteraceae bacterium]